jgi:hypothetical protein
MTLLCRKAKVVIKDADKNETYKEMSALAQS